MVRDSTNHNSVNGTKNPITMGITNEKRIYTSLTIIGKKIKLTYKIS